MLPNARRLNPIQFIFLPVCAESENVCCLYYKRHSIEKHAKISKVTSWMNVIKSLRSEWDPLLMLEQM